MDPTANLQEQERIIARRVAGESLQGDAARLRELREALACWLRAGGFEPAWTTAPRAVAFWAARGFVLREANARRMAGVR